MTSSPAQTEVEAAITGIEIATARLVARAQGLDEVALAEPSLLPGWTRAHVLSHVARNALALVNVLTSAATGTARTMYTSVEARNSAIAEGARGGPHLLTGELIESATLFSDAARALPADRWDAVLTYMPGRVLPARAALGLRLREIEFHHVDLNAGYTPAHWNPDFVDAQLDEAATALAKADGLPALVLASTDRAIPPVASPVVLAGEPRTAAAAGATAEPGPPEPEPRAWHIPGGEPSVTVSGPGAALLAWVCGRSSGDGLAATGGKLPALPAWP